MLYRVPLEPMTTLHEVLTDFASAHQLSNPSAFRFKHHRLNLVNMNTPFSLTGLETNAQLELVPADKETSGCLCDLPSFLPPCLPSLLAYLLTYLLPSLLSFVRSSFICLLFWSCRCQCAAVHSLSVCTIDAFLFVQRQLSKRCVCACVCMCVYACICVYVRVCMCIYGSFRNGDCSFATTQLDRTYYRWDSPPALPLSLSS